MENVADLVWGFTWAGIGIYLILGRKTIADKFAKQSAKHEWMTYGKTQQVIVMVILVLVGISGIVGGFLTIYDVLTPK